MLRANVRFQGPPARSTDLDDTSLHTADWHSPNASNLVHVLEGQAQGLVAGPLGGLDEVQGLQQNGSLVPVHVVGALNHVVTLEAGDGHEVDLHGRQTNQAPRTQQLCCCKLCK